MDSFELGPFRDVDGTEIIPLGFEEAHEPLSRAMGTYLVCANLPEFDGRTITVSNVDMTAFIQADWDRVFGPSPTRGFLLAYRAGAVSASPSQTVEHGRTDK